MDDRRSNFGYYELDNVVKYSICQNPHDDYIYAKGAYFGWAKVDPNDLNDFPNSRVQLVKDKIGYQIVLTGSGHSEHKDSTTKISIVDESIPL